MDVKEILRFCIEKGVLLEPEVLNLFNEADDTDSVKLIIENLKSHTERRIITKNFVDQNKEQVSEFFLTLPKEKQKSLEKLKIKLGLHIEISKEVYTDYTSNTGNEKESHEKSKDSFETKPLEDYGVKVLSSTPSFKKKVELDDFVKNFRSRFSQIKNILQERTELDGLMSINRLSNERRKVSLIGMVSDKRKTKNNNLIFEIEDLTGRTKVLISNNKPDIFEKAEEIALDSVIGFTGFADREIMFVNNFFFPESAMLERRKSPFDENIVFIGDIHYGSNLFFEEKFNKFIDYVNGEGNQDSEAKKIKYIFIVGDLVAGVGAYPGQEKVLKIKDLEAQFQGLAKIIGRIRKDVKIIISPGNHDGVRLMEPQPLLDEKYAWAFYNLDNVILTGNPSFVNVGAKKDFDGFNVLTYHGFSYPYYANNIPSLVKATLNSPEKIMAYLLQNRHLAPTHASIQALPSHEDHLVIDKIPDIFISGHSHKCAVAYHNNILLVSTAAWEDETENQKRKGNKPDFCKVPVMNLKTRAIKILDFE